MQQLVASGWTPNLVMTMAPEYRKGLCIIQIEQKTGWIYNFRTGKFEEPKKTTKQPPTEPD